ncbi:unnamed protein product [Linum trigynum]|uniref:Uncharacterized protein n=1 Tax=Linum trigynum TaxID=586398 RepID=A0AAV2E0S9_9ROSI
MGYYMAPRGADIQPTILRLPVVANNFEIKPDLVTMIQNNVQFHELRDESPREHIQRFIEIAKTLKINGVPEEALKLMILPYTLAGNVLMWLNNRPPSRLPHGTTCSTCS